MQIIEKYFVKKCSTKRATFYTFHEDGFYMTLKRRAQKVFKEVGTGPSMASLMIQDGLMISFHTFLFLAIFKTSLLSVFLAAVCLGMLMGSSHNFWHQSDNFRFGSKLILEIYLLTKVLSFSDDFTLM